MVWKLEGLSFLGQEVLWWPSFNLAGRYGVTEAIDLGARIGTSTYEPQSKFMLTKPFPSSPNETAIGAGSSDECLLFRDKNPPPHR